MSDQLGAETATYTTNTKDENPCHQWVSNPQSQRLSHCRTTSWNAWPRVLADLIVFHLNNYDLSVKLQPIFALYCQEMFNSPSR